MQLAFHFFHDAELRLILHPGCMQAVTRGLQCCALTHCCLKLAQDLVLPCWVCFGNLVSHHLFSHPTNTSNFLLFLSVKDPRATVPNFHCSHLYILPAPVKELGKCLTSSICFGEWKPPPKLSVLLLDANRSKNSITEFP